MANAEGRHTVIEALKSGREIERVYLRRDGARNRDIEAMAKKAGIPVVLCEPDRLDALAETRAHQGIIAVMSAWRYAELDELFSRADSEPPFLAVCDGVSDPGNLGAIIRSAEAAGVHGLILPKRRSAGLGAVAAKAASGALEHLPVARVSGIPSVLETLKKRGVWIYGADASGSRDVYETDFSGSVAIVMGGEGDGLSRLARERCDELIRIPMYGHTPSLNVSAAAAVLLMTAARQRRTQN